MTKCSCWVKYPNDAHKKDSGNWKCVDCYKCIRNYDGKRKTVCEKIEDKQKQEPCEDAVNRAEVLSVIHNHGFDNVRSSKISALLKTMRGEVERMPSVLPEYDLDEYSTKLWQNAYERGKAEQRTGRWVFSMNKKDIACSECGQNYPNIGYPMKYCPNCGAKMVEPQESEE